MGGGAVCTAVYKLLNDREDTVLGDELSVALSWPRKPCHLAVDEKRLTEGN